MRTQVMVVVLSCLLCACASIQERSVKVDEKIMMAVSHAIHGHPRAGDSRKGPIIVAGIETIDVTDANNSIIGHSYFKESEMVANDLGQLLNDRLPAAKRTNLVTSKDPSGQYWSLNANPAMSK